MSGNAAKAWNSTDRRQFIGGSDARIIMGQDEKALIRLWQEKPGDVGPEDLSTNLIVQLGLVTEDLNRRWCERNTSNARAFSAGSSTRSSGGWRPPSMASWRALGRVDCLGPAGVCVVRDGSAAPDGRGADLR